MSDAFFWGVLLGVLIVACVAALVGFGGRDGIAALDLEIDVEDCVSAMIEMRSGMVVELHLDFITPGERHSMYRDDKAAL